MSQVCLACDAVDLKDDFQYCPYCGTSLAKLPTCPSCGFRPDPGTNYCPKCGTALFEGQQPTAGKKPKPEPEVLEIPPPPSSGITIEFLHSTSSSFEFAVQAAQASPNFAQYREGNKAVYRATYIQEELDTASELLEYVKGWRRRAVYVDGEKVPWDAVFGFVWCYNKRKASFKPEFYCFGYDQPWMLNPWGCIQSQVPFIERADWCTWGKWLDNAGNWQFDRERIRHELQKNLYQYRFCPALDLTLVERAFEAFPETVNPKKDRDWKFVESWGDGIPGLVVVVTRYGLKDKATMIGAAPEGHRALQKLIQRVHGLRLPAPSGT
jgi:hypothetical protein